MTYLVKIFKLILDHIYIRMKKEMQNIRHRLEVSYQYFVKLSIAIFFIIS
jgi:hypothetical protein